MIFLAIGLEGCVVRIEGNAVQGVGCGGGVGVEETVPGAGFGVGGREEEAVEGEVVGVVAVVEVDVLRE